MRFLNGFSKFLSDNQALLVTLVPIVFAVVRRTQWGNANQEALTKVAQALENNGDPEVKAKVQAQFETASVETKAALHHAIAIADPDQTPLTPLQMILADLARLLTPKGAK